MAANPKNRPSNYVIATLQAVADGEMKYAASGNPWASLRAFISQGKDKASGEYKPSIWVTVKAFSPDENPAPAVTALQQAAKGARFTVKGRLGLEQWQTGEGETRQTLVIFAKSVEEFHFDSEAEPVDALEDEPA